MSSLMSFQCLLCYNRLGMIGEVVAGRADVAAENFQMNLKRFNAIDFTHHFLYEPTPLMLKHQDPQNIMVQ